MDNATIWVQAPLTAPLFDFPVQPGFTFRREVVVTNPNTGAPIDLSAWTFFASFGEVDGTVDASRAAVGALVVRFEHDETTLIPVGARFELVGTAEDDRRLFAEGYATVGGAGFPTRMPGGDKRKPIVSDVSFTVHGGTRGDQGADGDAISRTLVEQVEADRAAAGASAFNAGASAAAAQGSEEAASDARDAAADQAELARVSAATTVPLQREAVAAAITEDGTAKEALESKIGEVAGQKIIDAGVVPLVVSPSTLPMPHDALLAFWDFEDAGPSYPARYGKIGPLALRPINSSSPPARVTGGPFGHGVQGVGTSAGGWLQVPADEAEPLDFARRGGKCTIIAWVAFTTNAQGMIAGFWDESSGGGRRQAALFKGGSAVAPLGSQRGGRAQVSEVGGATPGYPININMALTGRQHNASQPTWMMVALTYDGQQLTSYLDGLADDFTYWAESGVAGATGEVYSRNPYRFPHGLNGVTTLAPFTVGQCFVSGWSNHFDGTIYGVSAFDRVLTPREIWSLYRATKPSGELVRLPLSNHGMGSGTHRNPSHLGIRAYRGSTAIDVSGNEAARCFSSAQFGNESTGRSCAFRNGSVAENVGTDALMEFRLADSMILPSDIGTITWVDGSNSIDVTRVMVNVGGRYLVSDQTFSNPLGTSSNTDWQNRITNQSFTMSLAANVWRELIFSPGVGMSVGALIATAIPPKYVRGFGLLHPASSATANSLVRITDMRLTPTV